MRIVSALSDIVEFEGLSCGSVFKDERSNICMKIKHHADRNVVYLRDGSLGYLDGKIKVEKVRCELVLYN